MHLVQICEVFARGIELADAKRPVAKNSRTGAAYKPGIGPHSESATIELALAAVADQAAFSFSLQWYYPLPRREKCDVFLTAPERWAIEVKLFRLRGDNGRPNDNMITHILSPYPAHRSALTDFDKLASSGFNARGAVMVIGYDYQDLSMDLGMDALGTLAGQRFRILGQAIVEFDGLEHPVHQRGRIFAWEVAAEVPPSNPPLQLESLGG